MKIAVLLSCYNGRRYLPAQLESLAKQTVAQNITVYIRDDGSSDSAFDVVEPWMDKLQIKWIEGENLGPAKSFWALLTDESIQADYYAFCDQDDVWDADKLEIAISCLNGQTHFYACNCRLVDGEGALLKASNQLEEPVITLPRLFVSGVVQGCAMVFTDALRAYIQKLDITCVPMHDVVVMLYALGFGGVVWDREPHFSYRLHGNNVVAKNNKSFFQKLRTVYWNWKNSSRNSMSTVAGEMLQKAKHLTDEEIIYLTWMHTYRSSITYKVKLLLYPGTRCARHEEKRSYVMRLLLNLL